MKKTMWEYMEYDKKIKSGHMTKGILFLLSLVCIYFGNGIPANAEIPAGNGKDPEIKKESLKARLSLSDDNIARIIANDPRPLHFTVAPPRAVNTSWSNFGKSVAVSKLNSGENESKTEAAGNNAGRESWTEADEQELNGLSIQVQCYTPPLMYEGINGPGPANVKSEWEYRKWMLRRIDELQKKKERH
jgi:hypothetical protein